MNALRVFVALICGFALGMFFTFMILGARIPNGIKVDLAPNGMAYCPTDSSTPHPTPCMFRQP